MSEGLPQLFARLRGGDQTALGDLTPTLYAELHRIALHHMRGERPGHTLQPTALVHEAYLKIFDHAARGFSDQVHFLAVASRVMRQVLVDHARARGRKKRSAPQAGGEPQVASLEVKTGEGAELVDLIELDDAMQELAREHPHLATLVEMRYFGGMTAEESAEALGQSVHVVRHDLRYAQAWLRRRLSGSASADR